MMRDFMVIFGEYQRLRVVFGDQTAGLFNWRMWLKHPSYMAILIENDR